MIKWCSKCGSQLLELWSKDGGSVWIACPVCDRFELDEMKRLKRDDDIEKVMGYKAEVNRN